ncbi:MAG: hypothetical protein K6G57_05075 [Lachnospiraceae bacterium]|nr:hypothetical protein [Lachnospiraceae bacterium]
MSDKDNKKINKDCELVLSKANVILYIIFAVLFILLPLPVSALLKDKLVSENNENRVLTEMPVLTKETIDIYPQQFDRYFSDHLPFRDQLITVGGLFDNYVMKQTLSGDVAIGKDNWLFYTGTQLPGENPPADYLGANLFTPEELELCKNNLVRASEYLAERDCEFAVVISPSKMSLYPEYLPGRYGEPAEYKRMQQIADYLRANTDLNIIWEYEPLSEYKASHPDEQLFLKYDTHENSLGSYVSASAIAEALGYEPLKEPDTLEWQEVYDYPWDLSKQMNLGYILTDDVNWWFPNFRDHSVSRWTNDDMTELRYTNDCGDGDPKKLMLVSDSFGAGMMPYLSDYFNESYMIFYFKYTPELLDKEDPDILVYQVTERLIGNMKTFSMETHFIEPD